MTSSIRFGVVLLAPLLALAGCGDASPSGSPTPSHPSAPTPNTTGGFTAVTPNGWKDTPPAVAGEVRLLVRADGYASISVTETAAGPAMTTPDPAFTAVCQGGQAAPATLASAPAFSVECTKEEDGLYVHEHSVALVRDGHQYVVLLTTSTGNDADADFAAFLASWTWG